MRRSDRAATPGTRRARTARAAVASELEIKLLAAGARELRAIAGRARLGPYRLRARDAVRLHSIYLDTAGRALARAGVALRLRRERRRWEATVKWAGHVRGALHERPELTVALAAAPALPFVLPAGPLAVHLAAVVAGRPLRPLLVTDIHRRRLDVLAANAKEGAPRLAELALDRVELRSPRPAGPREVYYEVEVERLHGTRRDLHRVARLLRAAYGLTPSATSKFARGLALVGGSPRPRVLPRAVGDPGDGGAGSGRVRAADRPIIPTAAGRAARQRRGRTRRKRATRRP